MKKIIFILMILSFNCFAQNNYSLKIISPQIYNGINLKILILDNDQRSNIFIDSALIKNGQVIFNGQIDQPARFIYITVTNKGINFSKTLVLDTGENLMEIIELDDNKYKNLPLPILTYNSISNGIKIKLDSIGELHYNKFGKKQANNYVTLKYEDIQKMNLDKMNYLKNYHNVYFSLVSLYEISLYEPSIKYQNEVLKVFNTFSENTKTSNFGKVFYALTLKKIASSNSTRIGQIVPSFNVKKFTGTNFTNNELKGKPYMIAFSATWCVPCIKYQPTLQKYYNKYKAKGFEIVYFNLDDNFITWQEHIKTKKLNWINVSERTKWNESKIAKQFNINSIPEYIIVNKAGIILYNSNEGKDFDYKLLESYIVKSLQ